MLLRLQQVPGPCAQRGAGSALIFLLKDIEMRWGKKLGVVLGCGVGLSNLEPSTSRLSTFISYNLIKNKSSEDTKMHLQVFKPWDET